MVTIHYTKLNLAIYCHEFFENQPFASSTIIIVFPKLYEAELILTVNPIKIIVTKLKLIKYIF